VTKRKIQYIHIFITWQDGHFKSFHLVQETGKIFLPVKKKKNHWEHTNLPTNNSFLHFLKVFAVFSGLSLI